MADQAERPGYVKLWRKLLDSDEWQTMSLAQFKIMVASLLLANWRDEAVLVGGEKLNIPRGSFLSSGRQLAKDVGVTEKAVRVAVSRLTSSGFMTSVGAHLGAHLGTVYTICNYERYQDASEDWGAGKGAGCGPQDAGCGPQDASSIYKKLRSRRSRRREEGETPTKQPPKKKTKASRPGTALLQAYYDCYKDRHSVEPVVAWSGKDLSVAEALLKGPPQRTVDALSAKLEAYVSSTDPFVVRARWPFSLFPSQLHKLQAAPAQTRFGDDDFYELAKPPGAK